MHRQGEEGESSTSEVGYEGGESDIRLGQKQDASHFDDEERPTLDGLSRSSRPLIPPDHVGVRPRTPDVPLVGEPTLSQIVRARTRTRHHTAYIPRMPPLELVHELKRLSVDDGEFGGRVGEQEVGRGRGEVWGQGEDVGS